MLTPVILFVYNRPKHTMNTIKALSENFLALETDLYIFSDGPKNNNQTEKINQTREFIESIKTKNLFKSVTIEYSLKNKGLASSVIDGVSKMFDKYDKVIVLEDDLVTSANFLTFMNKSLDFYKNNSVIWSISGFNIPIKIPKKYNNDVYLSCRGSSWGWATWRDRWGKVDWEVTDYNVFLRDSKQQKSFNRGGRDLTEMLILQMEGKIDSWAIRWVYSQSKLNMYTIYPVISFINNTGLDGTGTHSDIMDKYNNDLTKCNKEINLVDVAVNKKIISRFQNHYGSYLKYLIKKIIKIFNGRRIQ